MVNVRVVGIGHYLPERVITNAYFVGRELYCYEGDERVGDPKLLTHDKIVEITGISERRYSADDEFSHHMGAHAARMALEHAGVDASRLETIVVATETSQRGFPSTSSIVQTLLGVNNKRCVDVHAACAGFPVAVDYVVRSLSRGGYGLAIASETLSKMTDPTDINSTLFGDGAGVVLIHREANDRSDTPDSIEDGVVTLYGKAPDDVSSGLYGYYHKTDSSEDKAELIYKSDKGFIRMPNGSRVLRFAVREMFEVCESLQRCVGWSQVDAYDPHQANQRITDGLIDHLGVPRYDIIMTIHKYGNMSSATVVVGLSEMIHADKIRRGDKVIIPAVGGGLQISGLIMVV